MRMCVWLVVLLGGIVIGVLVVMRMMVVAKGLLLLLLAIHKKQRVPLVVMPGLVIDQVVIVLHDESVDVVGRGQGRVLLVNR